MYGNFNNGKIDYARDKISRNVVDGSERESEKRKLSTKVEHSCTLVVEDKWKTEFL